MKKFFIGLLIVVAFVAVGGFTASVVVMAFSEPWAAPPAGNVPSPINVGADTQKKDGDLELKNLKVDGGIELGGVFRNSWPEGTGGSGCNWSGLKCYCHSDKASVGQMRVTIGADCQNGQLTDVRIVSLDLSSRDKSCWTTMPSCKGGYTFVDQDK